MNQAIFKVIRVSLTSAAALTLGVHCTPPQAPPASATQETSDPVPSKPRETAIKKEGLQELESVAVSGTLLAPLPVAVTSFGAARVGGSLYTMGGYHGTPHAYSLEGQSKKILRLDLASPTKWEEFSELSEALQGVTAFSYEEQLCQLGGNHAKNKQGQPADMHSVAIVRCLNTQTKTWSDRPFLPQPRSSHEVARFGSRLYVAGGWDLRGTPDKAVWAKDFLTLDLDDEGAKWTSIPTPFQVRAAGVAATETHLVVAGGISNEEQPTKKVHLYNLAEKTWSEGPDYPDFAFGMALRAVDGVIYASGRDGMLRSFAPGDSAWKDVRPLAFARFFHQMVEVDETFVMLGGIGGMHTRGRTRPVEVVSLDRSATTFGSYVLPHPGMAKNRQGILRHGEELYLFGGNNSLGQHDFGRENFLSEGFFLDLATLSYQKAPSFPVKRQSMVTLDADDHGLAIGGFGFETFAETKQDDDTQAHSQKEVFTFDWAARTWNHASDLPRGRTQFGLERFEESEWIFGGLNYDPRREGDGAFDHVQDLLMAQSGKKPTFQPVTQTLPGPRRAFAGASLDGKSYFVGGMKTGFSLVDDCLVFDFSERTFEPFDCPGAARLSGSLVAAGGKLYLLGGMAKTDEGLQESRSVEVYDPQIAKWSKLDFDLPLSTRHLRALAYRDQILLLSTQTEKAELTMAILSPPRP